MLYTKCVPISMYAEADLKYELDQHSTGFHWTFFIAYNLPAASTAWILWDEILAGENRHECLKKFAEYLLLTTDMKINPKEKL